MRRAEIAGSPLAQLLERASVAGETLAEGARALRSAMLPLAGWQQQHASLAAASHTAAEAGPSQAVALLEQQQQAAVLARALSSVAGGGEPSGTGLLRAGGASALARDASRVP